MHIVVTQKNLLFQYKIYSVMINQDIGNTFLDSVVNNLEFKESQHKIRPRFALHYFIMCKKQESY